jgi:endonuclease/exonuclease/phosphatase family metal-dependent hydrolase
MLPYSCLKYTSKHSFHLSEENLLTLTADFFITHAEPALECLHEISQALFLPWRLFLQHAVRVIEPTPGSQVDSSCVSVAMRLSALVQAMCVMPFMVVTPAAMVLHGGVHLFRPSMQMLFTNNGYEKDPQELLLTKEHPLKIRTHNIALAPDSMNTLCDLRPPLERVEEIIEAILHDPCPPDVIFFQEAFHEAALKRLCQGIRQVYPYIIHSVLPHLSGFNSGAMVASKYRPREVLFERFDYMFGIENMVPRGILRISIDSPRGLVFLYGAHTQALPGVARSEARYMQLKQLQVFMERDAQLQRGIWQILVGDLNTSVISEWGECNLDQPEKKVLKFFAKYFHDIFLKDHDPLTGIRTKGQSLFMPVDNARIQNCSLPEPRGSWYHGPIAHKGIILSVRDIFERWYYGLPDPRMMVANHVSWGSKQWFESQTANTARMDYICVPKALRQHIDGHVEIRRLYVPYRAKSAISDHLPVDGHLWLADD